MVSKETDWNSYIPWLRDVSYVRNPVLRNSVSPTKILQL